MLHLIKAHGKGYLKYAEKVLKIPKNIHIIPVHDDVWYTGNLLISTNKGILVGEHNLDQGASIKVRSLNLSEPARLSAAAKNALLKADYIIFGPGDLYSSILPNVLASGFKETVRASKAEKILIVNIMNKLNETNDFKVSDFIKTLENYGIWIDKAIINDRKMASGVAKAKYGKLSGFVENDLFSRKTLEADLVNEKIIYEHDPKKLGAVLHKVLK